MTRGFVGVALAGSLLFSSTGAVAATAGKSAIQVNPWAALTAMSGAAPAAALCGAAAVAVTVQAPGAGCVLPAVDAAPPVAVNAPPSPIPVPPVEAASSFAFSPLILALGAVAAGALIYFLVKGKNGGSNNNSPN